jgi:hypothetical protein
MPDKPAMNMSTPFSTASKGIIIFPENTDITIITMDTRPIKIPSINCDISRGIWKKIYIMNMWCGGVAMFMGAKRLIHIPMVNCNIRRST